jgi:type II secretion system protein N
MKFKIKITRYTFGYAAFAVAALLVFLYLRFPGEMFARYLAAVAADMNPRAVMLIDSVKPSFVPGITFHNTTLGFQDNLSATIQADEWWVGPAWLPLFKGKSAVRYTAKAYGGSVRGQAVSRQFLAFGGPVDANLSLDGIDIGKIGYLKEKMGSQIAGSLKGSVTFSGPFKTPAGGTGNIEFTLLNGAFPLKQSIMGIERLEYRRVEAVVGIKNGVLNISRLRVAGDKINGTMTGDIALNSADFFSSQVSLNFTFELPGQNKKITLVMTGPLGNPSVKMI